MDFDRRVKILKICGPILIVCGFVGFFYVSFGGSDVKPKDVLYTVFFLALGFYYSWLSNNPEKMKQMLDKQKKSK